MQKITKNKVDYLVYRIGMAGTVEIFDIAVKSERQKGIGRELVQTLIAKTNPKRVYAFCRSTNESAHKFYDRLGFIGYDLPNFYEDGDAKIFIYETSK
jgi:ribosomal protein S18 acetylase RimI-like enzyme